MYETLAVWETDPTLATQSDLMADYANAWQSADKVVYSSTLATTSTANTQLERHFDPRAAQRLNAAASRDLIVGGPNLAAQALAAGLVDELRMFVWPIVLGGRTPAVPADMRADLELLERAPIRQRRRTAPLPRAVTTRGNRRVEQCQAAELVDELGTSSKVTST